MENNLITPGDWELKEQGDANEYCIITTDNIWVVGFRLNGIQTVERQIANGKLMAASKDLLEALVQLYESLPDGYTSECLPKVRKAITKATKPCQ